jgi:hypothetical protein
MLVPDVSLGQRVETKLGSQAYAGHAGEPAIQLWRV